ncbi:MAG: XcyI family restriction endonuclease [Pseudomonadota bacterium]
MPKVPAEVISGQYQLKATFFSNSLDLSDYTGLFERTQRSLLDVEDSLDWSNASRFGVSDELLRDLRDQSLSIAQHYCHPNALLSNPTYLRYYRCISALSQKGLKSISGVSSVDKIEIGKASISQDQSTRVSRAVNENLSAIYAISVPGSEKLKGLMYATAGTSIDGSWRNKIGSEGERVIRTLFLKELLVHAEIVKVTDKSGIDYSSSQLTANWLDENTSNLHSALATNGSVILFGSEPDIKLINSSSTTVGGVEIKAGIDPAGALERLGAMMKSFESIRSVSSEAETILVASCITDEVDQRLRAMKGVRTFIMTDVIQNHKSQGTKLMNIMRACIGLTAGYQ